MPETADPSVESIRSRGYCTEEQVQEALEIQQKMRDMGINPKPLAEILLDKGHLSKDQYREVSAKPLHEKGSLEKDSIPGYELLKKIGQGGMGAVFQARQLSMDRIVALKVLPPKLAKDAQFRERFMREARAVAKLNHENIIQGIDVGTANGLYFFVMEFVDGQPISKRLVDGQPLPEKEAIAICGQIARALEHAWRHKLVHRDVKPENIMTTGEGVAKLCDLGLAKQDTGDVGLTQAGLSVGTPNYISPEQARGEEDVDTRSDVYSLGASLYHLLTGKVPYEGTVPSVVMTKHITEELVPPSKHRQDLSAEANAIVVKAMQKMREDRYQDPALMAADLEAVAAGKPLVHARVAPSAKKQVAAGSPVAPAPAGEAARKPHHPAHAAPPKTSTVIAPIAIATVVALAIIGGVVMATKGKKPPENTGVPTNTSAGNSPAKVENPGGTGTGTGPAIDLAAEREKKIEQEYKALAGFIEANQADPARHADIESRLEEFVSAHRKTEWENKAIADRKKFRDGLDGTAQSLLAKIRAETDPLRKDGRTWEAYTAARSKWIKHLDATPTAKKFEELLLEIDAEMQSAWTKERDAAKALQAQRDFAKAQTLLDGVKKYASPQLQALAEALRAEIKKAGEEYTAQLAEIGRRRYDAEFWPALEKLLIDRKYKEGLTHCDKFLKDAEMAAVKDRIMAMIDDVMSLNLLMSEAAKGADAAIRSKDIVPIKKFDVRITSRDGDRVSYAFLNGGSSEIQIPRAAVEDVAVLCQLAFNTLTAEQKAAERGPFFFRIGLLFFFTSDDKDRKRAGDELEKASKDVARARWYLDRLGERGLGDAELGAKKLFEEAFELFDKKKYAEARQKFQKLLSDMAATAWVKARRPVIQQKITECDGKLGGGDATGIQSVLKGTVIKVYPRGAVEVKYDFSRDDQLQDWTVKGGNWNWDKDTQSLKGQAAEDVSSGINWNVPLVGDMSIEMDLIPLAERGIGITVHNDSAGHSYMALFGGFAPATAQALGSPDLKSVALTKINLNGRQNFSVFESAADPKAQRNTPLRVRVSRAQRALSLYVAGKKILSGEDDAWTRGQISLFLQGSEARFDEITIYGTPDDDWLKAKLSGGK
ncbi:MAG: serine/threonine protein [Planctomycetota bacterium]|nr:MAG: serine/threonine protein [Planctomycetota bacterium]